MTERWPAHDADPASQPRPLHGWACAELLAVQRATGDVILEVDASEEHTGGQHLLVCRCGERTLRPMSARTEMRSAPMTTPESAAIDEARLVLDARHETRGRYRDDAVCRIRIFARGENTPVVIASEVPENTNVSVTNFAEVLAAEVIARHMPQRFEHAEPIIWLEHYPPLPEHRQQKFPFDRVTFDSWTPRVTAIGGIQRISLGEPQWAPLTAEQLASLLGSNTARSLIAEGTSRSTDTHDR